MATFGLSLPASLKKLIPITMAIVLTLFFVVVTVNRIEFTDNSFLTSLEHRWIDAKFRMRGAQLSGGDIVIVGIDEKTLGKLGSYRTLDRKYLADLVDRLSAAGPKAIAFDVLFIEPQNPESDTRFAASIAKAGNVVLGAYLDLQSSPLSKEGHEATPMT